MNIKYEWWLICHHWVIHHLYNVLSNMQAVNNFSFFFFFFLKIQGKQTVHGAMNEHWGVVHVYLFVFLSYGKVADTTNRKINSYFLKNHNKGMFYFFFFFSCSYVVNYSALSISSVKRKLGMFPKWHTWRTDACGTVASILAASNVNTILDLPINLWYHFLFSFAAWKVLFSQS